jgi:hypothetical protein
LRWRDVGGSFFRLRCLEDDSVVLDGETTLREDTRRAVADSLARAAAPDLTIRGYARCSTRRTVDSLPRALSRE